MLDKVQKNLAKEGKKRLEGPGESQSQLFPRLRVVTAHTQAVPTGRVTRLVAGADFTTEVQVVDGVTCGKRGAIPGDEFRNLVRDAADTTIESANIEIKRNNNVPKGDREGRGNNGGCEDKDGLGDALTTYRD